MRIPYHPRRPELTEKPTGAGLEQVFRRAADFQRRRLKLRGGGWAELYWLNGMVRTERLNDYVIRPLTLLPLEGKPVDAVRSGGVWASEVSMPETLEQAATALTEGSCALALDGELLLIPVATEEKRGVESPEDEPDLKGPRDSFVEALRTNTSLVRRRLHSPKLAIRSFVVGRESRTKVELCWLEGITAPELVERAAARIAAMDVDALLDTQMLTDTLTDGENTLFPLALITQRPDRFCQGLMDGRVGVFCDGIAQGWLLPGTAALCLRAPQDQNNQWLVVRALAAVRLLCVAVSLLLPAGYIAMAAFHFGLMPTALAESIAAARQSVPFSPPLEVVVLLVAFEILQEAGQRIPQLNGQSVSIIGSLVVGQAAVDAKLLSPVVVVVVAAAGIAGYTMPNQDLANALRAVRLVLAVLASFWGALGIVLGLGWICCHLASLEPLGVPWLAPFAPDTPRAACDTTRVPVRRAKLREVFLRPEDRRNQR